MSNTTINLVPLDPDTLANDFKSYLTSQTKFKDFNFDGSNISVLIDILAHNTFKNNFYLNMALSETFIDTAQLSENIRSNAKDLNYIPRSATSARATISLNFSTDPHIPNSDTIVIPKGTSFNTVSNFKSYTYTVADNFFFVSTNNVFNITNLDVYEGTYHSDTYVMNYSNESQRFIISNDMVDISTIVVNVIEDNGSTTYNYIRTDTLLDLNQNSKIFLIQSGMNNGYEILFGDGVLGRKPKDGSVIQIIYRVSSGDASNGAANFSLNSDIGNGMINSPVTVTTVNVSSGGAFPESVESIRYNAPRYFQVQNRAVVPNDYELLLKYYFPEIKSIHAYGGEDAIPPQFGKIILSVYLYNLTKIPDIKKTEYINFIKNKCPTSIIPTFIDPEFMYYGINSIVNYNVNATTLSVSDINTLLITSIDAFNNQYLNDFDVAFKYSKFISNIDSTHSSITSNDTDIYLYKKIYPSTTLLNTFKINYGVELKNKLFNKKTNTYDVMSNLKSDVFELNGNLVYISDDGYGNLNIEDDSKDSIIFNNIGTIDYSKGIISITNLYVTNILNGKDYINFYVTPATKDFHVTQNQILTYEPENINISIIQVKE